MQNKTVSDRSAREAAAAKELSDAVRATPAPLIYAILFAVGLGLVETVIARASGSYVAREIVLASTIVWTVAAVGVWLVTVAAIVPFAPLVGARNASVLMSAIVIALGFAACALCAMGEFDGSSAIDGFAAGHSWLAAVFGVAAGATAGALAAREGPGPAWLTALVAAVSALFASAMSFFIWPGAKALTLLIAPPAVMTAVAFATERTTKRASKAFLATGSAGVLAAIVLVAAVAAGSGRLEPKNAHFRSDPGRDAMLAGKPNVVIVTLDTARADHMSLCGYRYKTTPNLEQFARNCRFFPYGETVDSWTLPAHASLFTGRYPREHGAHGTAGDEEASESDRLYAAPLAASQKTLATYLSDAGYNTAAFAANFSWLCRQFGLDRGFSYYYDLPRFLPAKEKGLPYMRYGAEIADLALGRNGAFVKSYWDASKVTRFAERWVRENSQSPFLLFLNYMDAHPPYAPPPPFDHIDGAGIPFDRRLSRQAQWGELRDYYLRSGRELPEDLARALSNQYDGGIAYMDYWLGDLMSSLKAQGIYDDALIIVTSDHGEHLGERRLLSHGTDLYEGCMRIPILVKYPRGEHAGEVVNTRVSIVDICATVFDVVKLPMPEMAGKPLGWAGRAILAESPEWGNSVTRYGQGFRRALAAVYEGRWKYIRSSKGQGELYDLSTDSEERSNRSQALPAEAAHLDSILSRLILDASPKGGGAPPVEPPQDAIRKLRSLGYIGGS